jgi:plastocyanin
MFRSMSRRRRPLRRLAALTAVVLTLGLVLSGCGSDDDPAVQGSGDTSSATDDGMTGDDDGHMGGADDESSDVAEDARRIEVTATSFTFDPEEIRLEAGEAVAIVLTSEDIIHDFTIDELDAHVAADRGETEEGGVTADEPGRYTYYCSVAGHREAGMEGTLVVG